MEKKDSLADEVYAELINNKTKEVFSLKKDLEYIGRSYSALICFKEVRISRQHTIFTKKSDGQCVLTSLGTAGTKINGDLCPYNEKINLKSGDVITVSEHEFTFKYLKIPVVNLEEEEHNLTEDANNSIEEQRNIFYKNQNFEKNKMQISFSEMKAEEKEVLDALQNKKLEAENQFKNKLVIEFDKELKNVQAFFHKKENDFLKIQKEMEEKLEEEKKKFEERLQKERDLEMRKLQDLKKTNCELEKDYNEVKQKQKILEDVIDSMKERVGRHLECGVCSEISIKPVLLNCGHTFCKLCISTWKKKKKDCPMCRSKIKSEIRNWNAEAMIEDYVKSLSKEEQKEREKLIKERTGEPKPVRTETVVLDEPVQRRRHHRNNNSSEDLFHWDEPAPARPITRQTRLRRPNNSNSPVEIDLTFFPDSIRVTSNIALDNVIDLTSPGGHI